MERRTECKGVPTGQSSGDPISHSGKTNDNDVDGSEYGVDSSQKVGPRCPCLEVESQRSEERY